MRWQHNLAQVTSRVEAEFRLVSRIMATIAAFVLVIMMLLTVADVSGRYFANRPIKGSWELIGLLLIIAATWGLAYCQIQRRHIRVGFLLERFRPRVQTIFNSLAYLIGLGGFSVICWQMLVMTRRYISIPTGRVSETAGVLLWPFMLMLAIGAAMLAIQLLIDLLHSLAEAVRK